MTKTFAGEIVPAAVIINGKNLFKVLAANNTALYPAAERIALNASIRCALEIRGTSSMENVVSSLSARD